MAMYEPKLDHAQEKKRCRTVLAVILVLVSAGTLMLGWVSYEQDQLIDQIATERDSLRAKSRGLQLEVDSQKEEISGIRDQLVACDAAINLISQAGKQAGMASQYYIKAVGASVFLTAIYLRQGLDLVKKATKTLKSSHVIVAECREGAGEGAFAV